MNKQIRVAVFDDNPKALEALEMLIGSYEHIELAGKFNNCNFLEQRIRDTKPDVVILDIDMPGINGIEAARIIKKKFSEVHILMQTVFDDERKVFESLCAGASGYIVKGDIPKKLADAIFEVQAGGSPMSPSIARKVITMFRDFAPAGMPEQNKYRLTPKETKILSLLVEGMSYKQIAENISTSFGTVHTHIKAIYRKLHVASMTEAVVKALREKLV